MNPLPYLSLVTLLLPPTVKSDPGRVGQTLGGVPESHFQAGSPVLADTTPPGDVTSFTAVSGDTSIMLYWTNPPDADFAGTMVRWRTDTYPCSTWDGTLLCDQQNTPGSSDSCLHGGLTAGYTYYYRAFAYDTVPNFAPGDGCTTSGSPQDTIPPSPPPLFRTYPLDSEVLLEWTNPSDPDLEGVLIMYALTPWPQPPDQGIVVCDYPGLPCSTYSFVHTGLEAGLYYFYGAFAHDAVDNYSTGSLVATRRDTTPPCDPYQFTLTPYDTAIALRWRNPKERDFRGTDIWYSTFDYPAQPGDGTRLSNQPNSPNSMDSCLHVVSDTSIHYYSAFAYDDETPLNYSDGARLSGSIVADTVPPGELAYFRAIPGDCSVLLSWKNPFDQDYRGTRVRYSTNGFPSHPDSGELVCDKPGAPGSQDYHNHQNLVNGTTYYYTAFTYDEVPNYSSGDTARATPQPDTIPPANVSNFTCYPNSDSSIVLHWVNPPDPDFVATRIRYSTTQFPQDPYSGPFMGDWYGLPSSPDTVQHFGELLSGSIYYYAAWAFDGQLNFSTPAMDSAYSPVPPQLIDTDPDAYEPQVIWIKEIAVKFNSSMNPSSFPGNVRVKGAIAGSYAGSLCYYDTAQTLTFCPSSSFTSLDTVEVTLSGSIQNWLGVGLDGNFNNHPEGPGEDDFTWSFRIRLLADYDADGDVDYDDFFQLRDAWNEQNLSQELGPTAGEAPYFTVLPDSVIDFEDLAVFVIMWNWSSSGGFELGEAVPGAEVSLSTCSEEGRFLLDLHANGAQDLAGARFILRHPPSLGLIGVEKGDLLASPDGEVAFIHRDGDDFLEILTCRLSSQNPSVGGDGTLARAIFEAPSDVEREIAVFYELRDSENGVTSSGTMGLDLRGLYLPETTALHPNYPNPFINTTTIPYSVQRSRGAGEQGGGVSTYQHINLSVYDVTGRLVRVLVNEAQKPGLYEVLWDGTDWEDRGVGSGVYFVRLSAGEDFLMRKMLRVR